jgi:hypothetical protein
VAAKKPRHRGREPEILSVAWKETPASGRICIFGLLYKTFAHYGSKVIMAAPSKRLSMGSCNHCAGAQVSGNSTAREVVARTTRDPKIENSEAWEDRGSFIGWGFRLRPCYTVDGI